MNARCQCGSITFKTPLPEPLALYICHCTECRKQTGSAFGTSAIFPQFKLPETDNLSCYARPTASGETLYCYFCRNCGTRLVHMTPVCTHHPHQHRHYISSFTHPSIYTSTPKLTPISKPLRHKSKNVVSVKGGCIEGLDWTKAIHIWTKSAMVPIPEGSEAHSERSSSVELGQTQELLD